MKKLRLQSGFTIPQLGLGTWQLTGSTCSESVREALRRGYTHIDTADAYGNHGDVAKGIKESGVARDSFFLTTKIPMGKQSSEAVRQCGDRMLSELETDYVDLLLIHWPTRKVPFAETFGALKKLVDKGYVKSIGISNFNKTIAAEAAEVSEIPIATNQVEFHPLLYQKELLDACLSLGMLVTAYSPLSQGKAFANPAIVAAASKHKASPARICIAWLLEKGIIAIPKASSVEHLTDNMAATDVTLDEEDIRSIDGIEETHRIVDGKFKQYEF